MDGGPVESYERNNTREEGVRLADLSGTDYELSMTPEWEWSESARTFVVRLKTESKAGNLDAAIKAHVVELDFGQVHDLHIHLSELINDRPGADRA